MIRIFIGYDPRESVAFYTLAHSIWRRATQPVSIVPIALHQLKEVHSRPRERFQSNDFTFSRWLVPHLCEYKGWAIFVDCDMIVRRDISELWNLRDDRYAVQVVKNNYQPSEKEKYLGNEQDVYERKNWSSVMLMNCPRCEALTPAYVNSASRLNLHQFSWINDSEIGELPPEWNHLVGYGKENPDAALVHFTIGGPYFKEYIGVEHTHTWMVENFDMLRCVQREEK